MDIDKKKIRYWTRQQTEIGRRKVIPVIILGLVSSVIAVGTAWCIAGLLGHVLLPTYVSTVSVTALLFIFIVLSLLRAGVIYVEERLATKTGIEARHRLRKNITDRILYAGPSLLRRQSSGALATLMIDQVESLDGYFSRWLPASVLWIASPVLILIFIYKVQPWSALIVGLCGLMVPVAQAVFGIGAALAARQQFLAMTRLQARFLDRIRGIATIVLAGQAGHEVQKLAVSADELRKRTMKILRIAFLSSASIDCAMIVAIILVVLMDGGQFLETGSLHMIPVTHILFTLLVIPDFFAPLRSLALAYQDKARLSGTAASVIELPEAPEPVSATGYEKSINDLKAIEVIFEHVSFSWEKERGITLDDLDFKVEAGETALLVGASGAGKSTVIEMLLGFISPDQGRILLNGMDIHAFSSAELSSFISWIGQEPVIFSGTIKENILFAKPDATEEELHDALAASAVIHYAAALPDGLNTKIGEGGYGVSGGQAQRIAIARAYLKNAPLLLLDEPTAHLDPVTEQDIFKQLVQLAQGRTVIMSTHSQQGKNLPGLHLYFDHGRLISQKRVG